MTFASRFQPGQKVLIGQETDAIVERVMFARNMTAPLIDVSYWVENHRVMLTLDEEDVAPAVEERVQ